MRARSSSYFFWRASSFLISASFSRARRVNMSCSDFKRRSSAAAAAKSARSFSIAKRSLSRSCSIARRSLSSAAAFSCCSFISLISACLLRWSSRARRSSSTFFSASTIAFSLSLASSFWAVRLLFKAAILATLLSSVSRESTALLLLLDRLPSSGKNKLRSIFSAGAPPGMT